MILAIGNGESRKGIDLSKLKTTTVGCNAIYRDFNVNHLICVDKRMIQEALDSGANSDSLVYTRKDLFTRFARKRLRQVPYLPYAGFERPDLPKHWGSGPYAVLLAAELTTDNTVGMIGFDLYGIENKINNIYKDTANYSLSSKSAVDPSYWIYQISKVFECYSKIQFIIYQTEGWVRPKSWKKSNVQVDNISNIHYNNYII